MRPDLFDKYHQITYPLQFSIQYQVKCGFMSKKPSIQQDQNAIFSIRVLSEVPVRF